MCKDAVDFRDLLASVRAPTPQELKASERVTAYDASIMSKITRLHENDEERRKWKAYHRNVRKYR